MGEPQQFKPKQENKPKPKQEYKPKPKQEYKPKPKQEYKPKPKQEYKPKPKQVQEYSEEITQLKWKYEIPKNFYHDLVKDYGKPDSLAMQEGGVAIWHKSLQYRTDKLTNLPNIYHKIEIKDEEVEHACPSKHIDFVYSYIKVPIMPRQLGDVLSLSGSVNYDMLKQELSARCGSLEANIATLYLCSHVILNHIDKQYMSILQIQQNHEYKKHLNSTTEHEKVKKMYKKLSENLDLIRSQNKLPTNYWPGAFSANCGIVQ